MRTTLTGVALLLACAPALAATPASGTLTIYETEVEFTEGPVIGVNLTHYTQDFLGPNCNPGIDCDRFALSVEVPDNLSEVFPTAILRMSLEWTSPTGEAIDEYEFYVYDADGNQIGSSEDLNLQASSSEAIALPARGGSNQYRLDVAYATVLGASHTGRVVLDLGEPDDEADVDAFYADNPPTESFFIAPDLSVDGDARDASLDNAGGGAFGALVLMLLGLPGRFGRQRQRA